MTSFARVCATRPLVAGRGRVATVGDVARAADRCATLVAARRLPDAALVALQAEPGPGFLAAYMALRRRGHPVLLLDDALPRPEVEQALDALGAAGLVRAPAWAPAPTFREGPGTARLPDAAVVKLTSGSSGAPRGVAVSADALAADVDAIGAAMGIDAGARVVAALPWAHSYGFSVLALPALRFGATLLLPDGTDALAAAADGQATHLPTVPAYLAAATRRAAAPALPKSLRRIVFAGAPLAPAAARAFRERTGRGVHAFYGASECGGITYDETGTAAERGTVGAPLPGVALQLRPSAGGAAVTVRSPAVGLGYVPAPDPALANGTFRSDDLAAWHAGELALRGRIHDAINVDGRKVQRGEVERVLGALPGVRDVQVYGRGPAGRQVVCAVIACARGALSYRDVATWCRARLAPYKVPRSIRFVPRLAYTARGKPRRADVG